MMQDMLMTDLAGLQEIVDDDMTFDDLEAMTRVNPNVVITIIGRILAFIKLLSRNSSEGEELNPVVAQLRSALNSFVEVAKEHNNGEMPKWSLMAKQIFNFAATVAIAWDMGKMFAISTLS